MKNVYLLSFIFSLALLIRIIYISNFPPSLNWDEVSLGYNSYSLLKTGRDEWGIAFPTIFRAFGDYKLPGYIYFSVLPTLLFGLNPFSTRLTSVFFGAILVFTSYLIAKKIFNLEKTGLYTALIISISPWTWFLSRIALEANVATSIFSIGLALYFSSFSPILTTLFLTLPVWIYNSYRIFVPLMLIPLFILNKKRISILTSFLILIPMISQLFLSSGQARFKWVSILDSAAIGKLEYLRNTSTSNYKNLLYNRYTYFLYQFSKNYLNHFSLQFLFLNGNTNFQFNLPKQGLLFVVLAPFFYFGVFNIFKNRNYFLISWLLLAPIAGSLTKDSPHTLRAITFLPLPIILISREISRIRLHLQYLLLLMIILFLTIYISFLPSYRQKYSWSWQYGYSQLVEYVSAHESKYDQIYVTKKYGEPHIFFLYFQLINPKKYVNNPNLNRYYKSNWYWVDSFGKYKFINDWDFLNKIQNLNPDQKYLLVTSTPIPATHLTDIKFLDGQTAFYLYEK